MHGRDSNERPFSGSVPYAMLLLAIAGQAGTIAITWPLWQARDSPVNLPLLAALPDLSFGWAMLASLVIAAISPKWGVPIHWIVLLTACAFDQFRLEPQFFGLAVLMLPYFGNRGRRFCRWYLIAMWTWTGLHKFLSPDWMGHTSWSLISQTGFPPDQIHRPFALLVATTEVTLGLLAWLRPRWASRLCVAVHLGIIVFMSPWLVDMNSSVIPWNLAIACIGYYVLAEVAASERRSSVPIWEQSAIAVLLLIPLGFYGGWIDRCFCHVMYSNYLPTGLITTADGVKPIRGWGALAVPFPRERRLFRVHFARTAQVGEKLHIADPRPLLADQYFVMRPTGPVQIDADEFFRSRPNEVAGIGLDRQQSLFALSRAGVKMLRETPESMVYAVAFTPKNFNRKLLRYLQGLPNLQQIQFSGTAIGDRDLQQLTTLRLLTGLGLSHTAITDQGLAQLADLPYLDYVETEGTSITRDAPD